MSSTLRYSALAVCCLALTALAFVTLGGGGSYMFVLYGGLLSVVLASFAYESHQLGEPAEPSP
ncbi:hypothetical protein ACYJ1Y_00945 [Natrialbaceae archaeon A-gly3]